MNKYTFILSTGRTGTLFFTRLFGTDPTRTLSLHEPPPSYHLRILSNAHSCGVISERWMLPAFMHARGKILASLGDRDYLEANNFIYGFINAIKTLTPSTIILHIVRDPRDYIRSYLNHGAWSGKKWLAAQLIPYWQPDVNYLFRDFTGATTPIVRFAAVWRHINEFIITNGQGNQNFHEFRFEDIFEKPNSGLERVIQVVGLPANRNLKSATEEKVNQSRNRRIGGWQAWSTAECRAVHQICGRLMERYGYGHETAWLKKLDGDARELE